MAETNPLDTVRAKLIARINRMEEALKAERLKLQFIDGAQKVLFEEGEERNSTNKVVELRKDKYKDMPLTQAVLDCIITYGQTRELSIPEILKILKDNGFKNNSKNLYNMAFVALKRLEGKGLIEKVKGKGFLKKQPLINSEPPSRQMTL